MKYLLYLICFVLATTVSPTHLIGRTPHQKSAGQFVLTFKNPHGIDTYFYHTKELWIQKDNLIEIFWDDTSEQLTLKKNETHQPVNVLSKAKYIILRHYVNHLDYNDYLLENTDSVLINYQKGLPHITILNRRLSKHDTDFEDLVRKDINSGQYSVLGNYLGAVHIFGKKVLSSKNRPKLTPEQIFFRNKKGVEEVKKELYSDCKAYLEHMRTVLDSLKNNSFISQVPYHFYQNKITNLNLLLDIDAGELSIEQIRNYLGEHINESYSYPQIYYRDVIKVVAQKYVIEGAKYVALQDYDHREVYDRIVSSTLFLNNDKNYLLTRQIHRIAHFHSRDDFLIYFSRYEKDVKDTLLVNSLKERYAMEFDDKRNATQSLILANGQGEQFTLEDLKKRHTGKVLYVDFWASWCAPCRIAFPHSIALRNKLKEKDIVFIYLSIDQTAKPWLVASEKEKLRTYPDSYLVVNAKTSDFVKQQKIDAIPRYMIFDKQGKLVYANAPKVENTELKSILLKLTE
jgi:thiol-disulfide isomerase/thioredoxin